MYKNTALHNNKCNTIWLPKVLSYEPFKNKEAQYNMNMNCSGDSILITFI